MSGSVAALSQKVSIAAPAPIQYITLARHSPWKAPSYMRCLVHVLGTDSTHVVVGPIFHMAATMMAIEGVLLISARNECTLDMFPNAFVASSEVNV